MPEERKGGDLASWPDRYEIPYSKHTHRLVIYRALDSGLLSPLSELTGLDGRVGLPL